MSTAPVSFTIVTENRQEVLDAEAKRLAEEVERKAIFHELEMDAAWQSSEDVRANNVHLQKVVDLARIERDRYAIRSYGYTRLSNIVKRCVKGSITQDMMMMQLKEAVEETEARIEAKGQ